MPASGPKMPPQFSRRSSHSSQNFPDSEGLGDALKQLCTYLTKGKSKKGQTKAPAFVKKIGQILKSYRIKSQKVHNDVLKILMDSIDSGGGADFCSQMEPAVFCVVLDTLLQADACPDNQPQRGLSYLSTSLHQDSTNKDMEDSIKPRKGCIGKDVLFRLFEIFSDMDTDDPNLTRRWIGILSIELLRASDENVEMVSTYSDDEKHGIARVMLHDSDEHIQIIAGELIKTLAEGGMEVQYLWPDGEKECYDGFPLISSSRSGWVKTFSQWLESVYVRIPELTPKPIGEAIYVRSVHLNPQINFGVTNHMAVLYLVEDTLSILTPTNNSNKMQILEVFLSCFKSVHTISDPSSQLEEVQLTLELLTDTPMKTFLDGRAIELDAISVTVDMAYLESLVEAIRIFSPDIEIAGLDQEDELDLLDPNAQQSMHVASAEILQRGSVDSTLDNNTGKGIQEAAGMAQLSSQRSSNFPKDGDEMASHREKASADVVPHESPKLPAAGPKEIHPSKDVAPPKESRPKTRNSIKPKAKPPISLAARKNPVEQEVHGSNAAIQQAQQSDKLCGGVQNHEILDGDTRDASEIQSKSTTRTSKNKPKTAMKVIARRPLKKAAPVSKAATQEKRKRIEKRENLWNAMPASDMNLVEDELTSPEPSISTGAAQDKVSPKLENNKLPFATTIQKKKYNLQGRTKESPLDYTSTNLFEIPDDNLIEKPKKKTNSKNLNRQPILSHKTAASGEKTAKRELPKTPAIPRAKRQSAPTVASELLVPVRESQRTAALVAEEKISDTKNVLPKSKLNSVALQKHTRPAATIIASIDGTLASDVLNATITNYTGMSQERSSISSKKELPIKTSAVASISVTKKESTKLKQTELTRQNSAENELKSDQPQKPAARQLSLVLQNEAFVLSDDNLNKKSEIEPAFETPTRREASRETKGVERKTKKSIDENFADKLGDVLSGILDVPEELVLKGMTKPTGSAAKILTAKSLSAEGSLPTTSPFPPSSNLIEEMSPVIVLDQDMPETEVTQRDGADYSKTYRIVGQAVGAPALSENNRIPVMAIQFTQEKARNLPASPKPQVKSSDLIEVVSSQAIRQTGPLTNHAALEIEVKEMANRTTNKDEILEGPSPQDTEIGNKTVPRSADIDISGNAVAPVSSNTSQTDGYVEHTEQMTDIHRKRKTTSDHSPHSKRRRAAVKTSSYVGNVEPTSNRPPQKHRGSPDLPKLVDVATNQSFNNSARDPARRPKLIAFNKTKGAMNQGQSSLMKLAKDERFVTTISKDIVEQKRKRVADTSTGAAGHSPPRKRQHSSPLQQEEPLTMQDEDCARYDYHPTKENSPVFTAGRPPSRSIRHSSQGSRVDRNGSPIASKNIDHMRKLQNRLGLDIDNSSPHGQQLEAVVDLLVEEAPSTFAARAHLSLKKKIRAASRDEEYTSRYIAHEKTSDGHYREVQTQELVATEAPSVDPFFETTKNSTPFAERLRLIAPRKAESTHAHGRFSLPLPDQLHPCQDTGPHQFHERRWGQSSGLYIDRCGLPPKHPEDLEKTLVNSDLQRIHQRSPDEMTNGYSPESRSSGRSVTQMENTGTLTERWNVAIRPHYTAAHDAIHRIADEVLIRLADEEDKMGLVVKQYDENGTSVFERLVQKREREKSTILQTIELKSKEMKGVYNKYKDGIQEGAQGLKETSVGAFEKNWKKRQVEIQKLIAGGVDALNE